MKPAEEPEFTAPDIFIDGNGDWHADGRPVLHEKILRLFRDSLSPDGRGGHLLRIGNEECPVRVEDAPFIVRRIIPDASGRLNTVLNDGTVEPFNPETLTRRGDTALYCRVRGGALTARIGRSAYPDIISRIDYNEKTNTCVFDVGGRRFSVAPFSET